jgi:hypothetical protein
VKSCSVPETASLTSERKDLNALENFLSGEILFILSDTPFFK